MMKSTNLRRQPQASEVFSSFAIMVTLALVLVILAKEVWLITLPGAINWPYSTGTSVQLLTGFTHGMFSPLTLGLSLTVDPQIELYDTGNGSVYKFSFAVGIITLVGVGSFLHHHSRNVFYWRPRLTKVPGSRLPWTVRFVPPRSAVVTPDAFWLSSWITNPNK